MNDLYSFHTDKEDLEKYYWEVAEAYKKIFSRLGLDIKVVEAAGGGFTSEYTHEFQVITPSGEDTIFYCATCDFAQNKEIAKIKDGDMCPSCDKEKIIKGNGIEVGNIFKLKTKYSEPFDLTYKDKDGNMNELWLKESEKTARLEDEEVIEEDKLSENVADKAKSTAPQEGVAIEDLTKQQQEIIDKAKKPFENSIEILKSILKEAEGGY